MSISFRPTIRHNVMAVSGLQGHVKLFFFRKTKRSVFDPVKMVNNPPSVQLSPHTSIHTLIASVHPNCTSFSFLDFICRDQGNNHRVGLSLRGFMCHAGYRHPRGVVFQVCFRSLHYDIQAAVPRGSFHTGLTSFVAPIN
jgi:hypothetical protein